MARNITNLVQKSETFVILSDATKFLIDIKSTTFFFGLSAPSVSNRRLMITGSVKKFIFMHQTLLTNIVR